jgi:hypothetical protein
MLIGLAMSHTGYASAKKSMESRMLKFRTLPASGNTYYHSIHLSNTYHRIPGRGYILQYLNFVILNFILHYKK